MGEFQIRSGSPGPYGFVPHFLFINKLIYSSKVSFKINVNEKINIYSSPEWKDFRIATYSPTFSKRPPKMWSLTGCLQEVVAYEQRTTEGLFL